MALAGPQPSAVQEVLRDHALDNLEHPRDQLQLSGQRHFVAVLAATRLRSPRDSTLHAMKAPNCRCTSHFADARMPEATGSEGVETTRGAALPARRVLRRLTDLQNATGAMRPLSEPNHNRQLPAGAAFGITTHRPSVAYIARRRETPKPARAKATNAIDVGSGTEVCVADVVQNTRSSPKAMQVRSLPVAL